MVAKLGPVEGVAETAAAFDNLAADVANMPATHDAIARARLPAITALTPVRTGALSGTWSTEPEGKGSNIVSPLAYAAVIEYGSDVRGIAAVRMVHRALEAENQKVADEYGVAILAAGKRRGFPVGE